MKMIAMILVSVPMRYISLIYHLDGLFFSMSTMKYVLIQIISCLFLYVWVCDTISQNLYFYWIVLEYD